MEVGVRIEAEDLATAEVVHTGSSYMTFVALDGTGIPTLVPYIIPETREEKRRYEEAKDIAVKDDMKISAGRSIKLQFLLTPGHSPESMCIIVNDFALITGDTLFIGECGRTDLSG